ncbi:hypothetical protein HaLaN_15804 [Haematococcus lacustris]|uniref:Uncharacterized protein n=1 Tax=Haematococcus lacustris TaxID=44745 RepID=A0A699Z8F1_HAELA|nr:hypothetical protein HaLaN_15804 [Haematococcus lacustris]
MIDEECFTVIPTHSCGSAHPPSPLLGRQRLATDGSSGWESAEGDMSRLGPHTWPTGNQASTSQPAYTAYLAELQAPAGSVPLLRCTTLVAQALRHPARQHSWVEAAMDRLARKVARQLPAAPAPRYPLKVLRTLLDVLYNQQVGR